MRVRLVWLWVGALLVGGTAVLIFYSLSGRGDVLLYVFVLVAILIGLLASVISLRRPGNRVAWLLHAASVALLLVGATTPIVESELPPTSFDVWNHLAAVAFNTVAEVGMYPVLLILWVFPTGRFLTRRWSWAGWASVIVTVAMLFVATFIEETGRIYDDENEFWNLPNPVGFLPQEFGRIVIEQAVTLMVILAVGGVVAMVVRYRRSDLVAREQIKWMAYAAVIAGIGLNLMTMSGDNAAVWTAVPLLVLAVVPIAVTIAITRYRLFEIDRIISRTVSYAVVVGLLALVFAAGVIWLPSALGLEGSSLAVAGSTLAVAALFNPLRKRVQGAVDRRFNRSGYQMELVSEQFAAELREPHSIEEIAAFWKQTVDESLQPQASGIWLRD